jgi:hypothetical protein
VSVTVQSGAAIPFEEFWVWLKQHPNCLLRAGSTDTFLYDHENFHWQFEEDADRNPNVLLVFGKTVVGELLIDTQDVLFVQAMPDKDSEQPGQFVFEVIGGSREEPFPVYHFLLTHGLEGEMTRHQPVLKH